jgi:hypothetical protein
VKHYGASSPIWPTRTGLIQFVNDFLSVKLNDKFSQGSSFSGFGASSFPGNFKSKDFEIHDSSIGKTAPVCDKSF